MTAVVSMIFCVICFPHEGNIFTIEQVNFDKCDSTTTSGPNILMIENSVAAETSMGVGMYPSLMGTFHLPAPVPPMLTQTVFVISHVANDHAVHEFSFKLSLFDPTSSFS